MLKGFWQGILQGASRKMFLDKLNFCDVMRTKLDSNSKMRNGKASEKKISVGFRVRKETKHKTIQTSECRFKFSKNALKILVLSDGFLQVNRLLMRKGSH